MQQKQEARSQRPVAAVDDRGSRKPEARSKEKERIKIEI